MAQFNDIVGSKIAAFLGHGGAVDDLINEWLREELLLSNGFTVDLWEQWFTAQGVVAGSYNDRLMAFFDISGVPAGSFNDRWVWAWENDIFTAASLVTFNILNSAATLFVVTDTVRNSTGTAFTFTSTVRNSAGTAFTVI